MSNVPPKVLAAARAAMVARFVTTATVLRRSSGNASIRGGAGGPFAAVGTIQGRLRPVRMVGNESGLGGRTENTGAQEFLCAVGSDLTSADQLQVNGITYEVVDLDSDRAEQLVLVATLRKAV